MRSACRLSYCFVAKCDQPWIKWNRLDAPDLRPIDSTAFFLREALTRLPRLIQHRLENPRIKISHIERRLASSHHGCHNARKSLHAAYCSDGVPFFLRDRDFLEREFPH